MAEPSERIDPHAATLVAALSARAQRLAAAAREASEGIERERAEIAAAYEHSALADQLIDAVRGRVEGIRGDTRGLAGTLERFGQLVSPPVPRSTTTAGPAIAEPAPEGEAPFREEDAERSSGRGDGAEPRLDEPQNRLEVGREAEPQAPEIPEGLRLLATQMSVAGSSAGEIAVRLRDEFGVERAAAIVAEIFDRPGS